MDETLKLKMTNEMEEACRHWSADLKAMLRFRFGEDKMGHFIMIFPFGPSTTCSWISDADRASVIRMLKHLVDHLERPDAKIILPH